MSYGKRNWLLDVPFRRRPDDLHPMSLRDAGELPLGNTLTPKRLGEVCELSDHRGGEIEVQLAACNISDSETMSHTLRNEDERSRRTDELAILQGHDVLTLEHVERLRAAVVDVDRRSESRRLLVLDHRYDTTRVFFACLHGHADVAQGDDPPFTRAQHVWLRIHDEQALRSPQPRGTARSPECPSVRECRLSMRTEG